MSLCCCSCFTLLVERLVVAVEKTSTFAVCGHMIDVGGEILCPIENHSHICPLGVEVEVAS